MNKSASLKLLFIALASSSLLMSCAKKPNHDTSYGGYMGEATGSSYQDDGHAAKAKGATPKHEGVRPLAGNECASNPFLQKYGCSVDQVEAAAEHGASDAQYALGYMYFYGIGTIKDQDTATYWIRKAANQGQPLASEALNMMNQKKYPNIGKANMKKSKTTQKGQYQTMGPLKISHHNKPTPGASSPTLAKSTQAKETAKLLASVSPKTSVKESTHDLMKTAGSHYTVQILGSHSASAIKAFANAERLTGQAKYYHSQLQNKDWYVLLYGDFTSASDARAAIAKLPSDVQALNPWVRSISNVQADIKNTA